MDPEPRDVLMIIPEESLLLEAAGIADIFRWANVLQPRRHYRLVAASTQRHRVAHGSSGLNLLTDVCLAELSPHQPRDTILVTGRGYHSEERDEMAEWLALAAPAARRVVSVCAGAFVLAQAGLLKGRRATTHWARTEELARHNPETKVVKGPMFVTDGPVWTSGGASSGFDLALALVAEDGGAELALEVAQHLVLFVHRPGGQTQFSQFSKYQAPEGSPIFEVQSWALDNLNADLGVEKLADRAAMSPRNFARVFTRETGTTPARFVEQARLDAARRRLEHSRETLERVAWACGLGNALNLRRAFEKHLGVSPSDYRARFGMI